MTATSLTDDEFAALMEPLGPFERPPQVAVAVSGGADSLALCLLTQRWSAGRGGAAIALTVDHGLRPEGAAEAVQVGHWLAGYGLPHHVLRWTGTKPSSGLQAAARQARYALLQGWCAEAGVLHLLLAHHQDDQAETLLLRLARGSGADGLSAMPPVSWLHQVRVVRPLLSVPRARLAATLTARAQSWIDDPSNADPAFRRVRVRRMMPALAAEGLDSRRLANTALGLGRARKALEAATTDLLVAAVALDPRGFAWLDPVRLKPATGEIALRLIARVCRTIGGGDYPPRLQRLQRLYGELSAGLAGSRTFGGCILAPAMGRVLVYREPAAVGPSLPVSAGQTVVWDGRFTLRLVGEGRIGPLGRDGWHTIRREVRPPAIPRAVLPTLPALYDDHGIFSVPHLRYERGEPTDPIVEFVAFTPVHPLAGTAGCLV
jgi:tRNA(Ile)-lysidine synthase